MTALELPVTLDPAAAPAAPTRSPAVAVRELYVVGGKQRGLRTLRDEFAEHWYEYDQAVIAHVDTVSGRMRREVAYVSPPEATPEQDPAILFKSGTRVGDRLYLCTQTEVMVYRLPSFEREAYVSLPSFNDVHHVRPTPEGDLLVAVTGLDMVAQVTLDGRVVREWNVHEPTAPVWGGRFSPETDYRRLRTTKPHLAHPNHVFYLGDEPWASRFEQRDAISLLDPTRRMDIGLERLHDGIVYGDRVYFTTVDGRVAIMDAVSLERVAVIDLREMHEPETLLGWTRGLLLDGDRLWVGFSRIRPTKFRANVAWVATGFKRSMPTHLGCYDLRERRLLQEIDVEPVGLNAIFGIYAA